MLLMPTIRNLPDRGVNRVCVSGAERNASAHLPRGTGTHTQQQYSSSLITAHTQGQSGACGSNQTKTNGVLLFCILGFK